MINLKMVDGSIFAKARQSHKVSESLKKTSVNNMIFADNCAQLVKIKSPFVESLK